MGSISPFAAGSPAYALGQKVQRQFIEWRRSTPLGLRRIPEELWNAATKLAVATTVYKVARLLGLDYSLLKKRVIISCGPECPALPGHDKRKNTTLPSLPPPAKSEKETRSGEKQNVPVTRPLNLRRVNPHHPGSTFAVTASYLPQDGFIEAKAVAGSACAGPPLLAEICSSKGALLRLFSPETSSIIQAFLQS